MILAKAMAWGVPVLALLMLGLTLTPAEVWKAPATDSVYKGFDSNLVYTSNSGGSVQVSSPSLGITSPPGSNPSATLATTLLPKLEATLDATITANSEAAQPLRIGIWSPWTGDGYLLVFGRAPQDLVTAETIAKGASGPSLIGGNSVDSMALGSYRVGSSYHLLIRLDKSAGQITESVSGDGVDRTASLSSRQSPGLFGSVQVSVTASAIGGAGASQVELRNFSLTLPHQRWWASKVDDPVAGLLLVLLAVLGGVAVAIAAGDRGAAVVRRIETSVSSARAAFSAKRRVIPWLALAVAGYLVGNALLFPLGGHPFDMGVEKIYAYVAKAYGLSQLYYLPNTVSLAGISNGVPFIESPFPYEPVSAYLSAAAGWLTSIVTAGGGAFRLDDVRLEYVIKALNVLFGLADGALIFAILRQLAMSARWSLIAAALFVFNPATWFSMSVWGQTHVFSLFLVLLAVLLAEKRLPLWAWLALAAACLTRPQMLVFGLLLGIVFLRKFSWRENLSALSWTVVLAFLALIPFTLATSPSLPVDIMLNNFHLQEAGGNTTALATVSQDAYSVWPLLTRLFHGPTGPIPSTAVLIGDLTYQRLSQILTFAAMIAIGGALVLWRRVTAEPGGYLPLVALGMASFLMLLTGIVATHFLLALPFLLLCRRWMVGGAYLYVAAIWTVTTLVPMYGDMGLAISTHAYPLLAPANNVVTKFFVQLYSSDRFVFAGIIANICAVLWLAYLAVRRAAPAGSTRSTAT